MNTFEPIRYFGGGYSRAAVIVKRGRAYLHLLVMDAPVKVLKVPKAWERYSRPLLLQDGPYPPERALKMFREAAGRIGATPAAQRYLS